MANATASDVAVEDIVLNGGKIRANVTAAITTTMLTQTITGASTIEFGLHDPLTGQPPARVLAASALTKDRTTVTLDDLRFELAGVSKQGNILSLTFEDYAVGRLRRHNNVVTAAPGTTSRVEFCRRLIAKDEPWIVVDGPTSGPTILEAISTGQTTSTTDVSALDTPATGSQVQLSEAQAATYLYDAGFRGQDLTISIAVAHAESGFDATDVNHDSNGTSDWGLMQINSSHGYSESDMFDPAKNTTAAYKLWKDTQGEPNGGWKQWSTYNSGKYKHRLASATTAAQNVTANGSAGSSLVAGATNSTTSSKPENHWNAITRIMGEIRWRVFARRGHIVIAPDSWLLQQPGVTISETDDGIDSIDFDIDRGQKVSNVTVTCRADRWTSLPGEPVTISGLGPADDTWLLSQISRSLASTSAQVQLVKKQKTLPEPTSGSADTGSAGVNGTKVGPISFKTTSDGVRKMVTWALAKAKDPSVSYLMGGTGPDQYDCSGFVLKATAAGGHQIGARTAEEQFELCNRLGLSITPASAINVCGALMYQPGSDPKGTFGIGHTVISLGNGQFVAAEDTAEGVGVFSSGSAAQWTRAALAPGFSY
jgi:hypothetical protein